LQKTFGILLLNTNKFYRFENFLLTIRVKPKYNMVRKVVKIP
jgi:hypothetical protein